MADDTSTSALRDTWEQAAPGWAKWEHVFATSLCDVTDTLMDRAGIGRGMRVLDVACGAGSQSIEAARRVGPGGRVVASDISASMLAMCARAPPAQVSRTSRRSNARRRTCRSGRRTSTRRYAGWA